MAETTLVMTSQLSNEVGFSSFRANERHIYGVYAASTSFHLVSVQATNVNVRVV